jgi:glycerol-3-phosphate dehydrogenase
MKRDDRRRGAAGGLNHATNQTLYDLAIIGGGINGCGIARDAAGRGLSVLLVEQGDLASGTSSASTRLIHGGLRYLEHCAFRLVHDSLVEREVLLRSAPHLIRPMRFVLPHHAELRPLWLIRLGLFLYDHLGGREIRQARARSTCDVTRPARRCAANSGVASSTPTAGRMMRGLWWPTRGMPPRGVRISAPEPAACERPIRMVLGV